MDISRPEQRLLHTLAQGGKIVVVKNDHGKVRDAKCFTREGWLLVRESLRIFRKLKAKRAIISRNGGPYRITQRGLELVRSQLDNR